DDLLPRWRRVYDRIGWPAKEAEWPRSLAWAPPGPLGEERAPKRGTAFFRKFRRSLLGRPVTGFYMLGDMLWLYVDSQAGEDDTGYVIMLDPCWQIWEPGGVLIGSDFYRTHGAKEAEACERADALVGQLIGEPITGLEVQPRSNALAVEVGG